MQQLLLAIIIILIIASISDIKKQTVPLMVVLAVIILGAMIMLLRIYEEGWQMSTLLALTVGGLFLILSKLLKNSWGLGDSLIIIGLAEATALPVFISTLFLAFFLSGTVSLILIVRNKENRTMQIPFVPFLTAGLILMTIK